MRRGVAVLVVAFLVSTGTAEAGVGNWVKNSWTYLTSPVNCIVELGRDVLAAGVKFGTCVIANVNRNPATLNPMLSLPSAGHQIP
jgi:hypothetical protein